MHTPTHSHTKRPCFAMFVEAMHPDSEFSTNDVLNRNPYSPYTHAPLIFLHPPTPPFLLPSQNASVIKPRPTTRTVCLAIVLSVCHPMCNWQCCILPSKFLGITRHPAPLPQLLSPSSSQQAFFSSNDQRQQQNPQQTLISVLPFTLMPLLFPASFLLL